MDLGPGDEVSSGTVNQFGSFDMEARRVGEDSSIQRMIRLVESADAGKAKIVRLADRWATWVVVTALTAAVLTWMFTGQIIRAVTILVVFCPCALVLATPTAIMAAIGNATRHGFLVREGDALERLAQVKRVAFDKTGTLTYGKPQVSGVESLSKMWTDQELYAMAAGAESRSEHPLGKAVVACYRESTGQTPPACEEFAMLPGRGVQAQVEGHAVLAGNRALLEEAGVALPTWPQAEGWLERGSTLIYLSVDGKAAGFLALSDAPRPDGAKVIRAIQEAGAQPVLLTGDHAAAAKTLAGELGISCFQADCLPQDKLNWIDASQQEGAGVCMVGDGINDAPALKRAMVGVAMGGVGSDIAVEAADIALVNDDIGQLPHLLRLSRKMMNTIKANMTFSMALNFLAIVLAIRGDIDPVVGALVHNAGSVLVILNSARLLGMRTKG